MRRLPAVALVLTLGFAFAACGNDKKAADTTTTTSAPTTTTSTTSLTSTSPVALALDDSILTGQQVQAALGVSAAVNAYPGTSTAPPPPQGPLSVSGIAKVFPSDAYKGLLEQAKAVAGANRTYLVPSGTSGYVVNVLAIKFPDAANGGTFVTSASQVATTFGGGKANSHPEVKIGVTPGTVLVVPPAPGATNENVVTLALYQDGVYYQVSAAAPPGMVKDDVVIKLLKAQDAKYQGKKGSIPAA
ncbi:MAG TPA: hypothetical protein VGO92_10575 [Acidimicrobiales bacterium]|jgi:hypothetical protein|nr:hypothetical protein [Acidimicrobiales bacterium]